VSKSHCHTVRDATTGIAHASRSPVWVSSRTGVDMTRMTRASPTPSDIVTAALTKQKATVRAVTRHR
jgi:hypothetical protein